MSADTETIIRVAICGAGFSGSLLARQLERIDGVEVVIFDSRKPNDFKSHWTQPLSGAGLNLNPNAVGTLKEFDAEMHAAMSKVGYLRRNVRFTLFDESHSHNSVRVNDIVKAGLSDTYGLCCRWDDANRTVQTSLKKAEILWARKIRGYSLSADGTKVHPNVDNIETGEAAEEHGWFDLLVGCDGRYSDIRKQNEKNDIPVDFEDVCNFRILVPATDKESGLFNVDDLTLMYNVPVVEQCDGAIDGAITESKGNGIDCTESDDAHADVTIDYSNAAFRGLARVGVVRCPPTELLNEGSIYIFGNFAIEGQHSVPESSRTKQFLRALFMPKRGPSALSPEGQFLHRVFEEEAEKMHWARFQHVPPKFFPGDEEKGIDSSGAATKPVQPVFYLGDAAHAFSPALGQGATTSIEDAYAAGKFLIPALESAKHRPDAAYETILNAIGALADYRRERIEFIVDMSTRAGLHLLPGQPEERLKKEMCGWTDEGEWRDSVR